MSRVTAPAAVAPTRTHSVPTASSCTNLANGTERAHERTERVSEVALEANLGLMLALVDESAG